MRKTHSASTKLFSKRKKCGHANRTLRISRASSLSNFTWFVRPNFLLDGSLMRSCFLFLFLDFFSFLFFSRFSLKSLSQLFPKRKNASLFACSTKLRENISRNKKRANALKTEAVQQKCTRLGRRARLKCSSRGVDFKSPTKVTRLNRRRQRNAGFRERTRSRRASQRPRGRAEDSSALHSRRFFTSLLVWCPVHPQT